MIQFQLRNRSPAGIPCVNHRRCRVLLLVGILASCATTYIGIRLTGTEDMTIQEAMDLLGNDLTAQQRKLVAAALRRQGLAAVRQLLVMARVEDAAGVEARTALLQFREALK